MYFAYLDESGDRGYTNSPSAAFTLACVLVSDRSWTATLDLLVSFRRFLRDQFKIRLHDEIKAHNLLYKKGPMAALKIGPDARMRIYRQFMRLQPKASIKTFAVVIDKGKVQTKRDPQETAWTYAIQRIERFGASMGENIHILPDSGNIVFARRLIRKMRRFNLIPSAFDTSTLSRPARNIVEDPSERLSHESYFIQLADLNAYAAYRHVKTRPAFPQGMWNELGTARVAEVNTNRVGPTGIVVWPQ